MKEKDNKYCYFCAYRYYDLKEDEQECLMRIKEEISAQDIACEYFEEY